MLELTELPIQDGSPRELRLPKTEQEALDQALNEYLQHDIIEPCNDSSGFYSGVFPRCKKEGSARVILNLKELNEYVDKIHFKMDTIKEVVNLISPGIYFASIDFKNAYFSVPVAKQLRSYFKFIWHGKHYQFTCLPQGLSSAPRIFTKLMKPVFAHLRAQGYTAVCYIDDCIIMSSCPQHLNDGIALALSLFDSLGLTVNIRKSVLQPVQNIEFLGFILDSLKMTVTLTPKKTLKIQDMGKNLAKQASVTIREFASFIGNLVAIEPAMENAPLHYKPLEMARNAALSTSIGNYDSYMQLTDETQQLCLWWSNNIHKQSRTILSSTTPDQELFSDASLTGWGAKIGTLTAKGHWDAKELAHINILELRAALFALKALCSDMSDVHIRLRLDNTTAVACINNVGSIKPSLLQITTDIINWADARNIMLTAAHIPGIDNVDADRASRDLNVDTEWMLKPSIFQRLTVYFGQPDIDLFATRINKQIEQFISWKPDPDALFVDALLYDWSNIYGYAFPPFSLVSRVLQQVRQQQATILMILPLWTTRAWFPQALELLIDHPRLLPRNALVLPQVANAKHPLAKKLTLAAMRLSGRQLLRRQFQAKLRTSSQTPGDPVPLNNIGVISRDGCYFVMKGKIIHFRPL